MDRNLRKEWSLLRYNYYSAARAQLLTNNLSVGGILFGYAIETSFKQCLIESGYSNDSVLKSHEPQKLMSACKELNLFNQFEVSDEFLDYINDHFKPRYPSLKNKIIEDMSSTNRFYTIGPLLLSWYDDLMFELDNWLIDYTNDPISSCFLRASRELNCLMGRLVFHANYHACFNIEKYKILNQNYDNDQEPILWLEKGHLSYWSNLSGYLPAQKYENVNYSKNFSKRFYYPKWSEGEKQSITLLQSNCIVVNQLPWE